MELPDMKKFIFSMFALTGMFAFISCERHEWEDSAGKKDGTKNLYPQHEEKGHGEKDDSHKGHKH